MLTDTLAYYTNEAAYTRNPKDALGVINLNAYFACKVDGSTQHEFMVSSYPKSLVCRASSAAEMDDWINAIMWPTGEFTKNLAELRAEKNAREDSADHVAPQPSIHTAPTAAAAAKE